MDVTQAELETLLGDLESHRVERTVSFEKGDKFREASCAFANDGARAERAAVFSRTWDARPSPEGQLDDLSLDLFVTTYRARP